jgi:hypothetical protein
MSAVINPVLLGALSSYGRRPRLLMEILLPSNTLYVSDQLLGPADGLTNTYLPLVEDWGNLTDQAGSAIARDHGLIRQMSVTLWNGGSPPLSDRFLVDPPETVEVLLYQWAAEKNELYRQLIDRFYIADPIEFDEASRLLTLDLVSMPYRWDMPLGTMVDETDWPHADPAEIGKWLPVALGSPGRVPAYRLRVGKACTLATSILATVTSLQIPVNEDLDALNWPTSGALQLDEEIITHTGRTSSAFTGCTRGESGTLSAQHLRNAEIVEHITDHTFGLAVGPLSTIDRVFVGGYPAPSGIYALILAANPARITFNTQPYAERFSSGSKFLEMNFDAVGAGNTALYPEYAFDTARGATAAMIRQQNPKLVLTQTTVNPDLGAILKAYISVAHWEKGLIEADYVQLTVSGVGGSFILSRPNPQDEVDLTADIDIDHGHVHQTGAAHYHTYTDPNFGSTYTDPAFSSSSPAHGHSLAISTTEIRTDVGSFPIGSWIEKTGNTYTKDYISFPAYNDNNGVWVQYSLDWYTTATYLDPIIQLVIKVGGSWRYINLNAAGGATVYIASGAVSGDPYIQYKAQDPTPPDYTAKKCKFRLSACQLVWHANNSISDQATTVNTAKTASGSVSTSKITSGSVLGQGADNNDDPIKAYDDVVDLTTDNRPLDIHAQNNPSRTIVDIFDITSLVNFNWGWFTNRSVTMEYISAGENKAVHVLHVFFGVEFAPREMVFSDEISAEITATRSAPAECIQHLLTDVAGVPAERIDTASFNATAAEHAGLGYTLDGLLPGDMSVREAVKRICRQTHSRLFTSGGKVKLVAKKIDHETAIIVDAALGGVQLKSISVSRRPLAEVANRINLAYDYDHMGDAGYRALASRQDDASIARYGLRQIDDRYQFDLIRDASMAAAVAKYYLDADGNPHTWYKFALYLSHLGVEPEDSIHLVSGFHQPTNWLAVRSVERVFGSGKSGRVNRLLVTAEANIVGANVAFPYSLPFEVA